MMCPGNSRSKIYEELLMLNDGTVNWNVPYDDLCSEKHVNVAYNQEDGVFELDSFDGTVSIESNNWTYFHPLGI